MLKLFLFCLTINYIVSEQILTISVQEKKLMNADEGDLMPLIVKPSEDVNEEIIFKCNGNIRFTYYSTGSCYDTLDEKILPKNSSRNKSRNRNKI